MMDTKYQPIWEHAKPYLNTRSNDRHTWYCYFFAEQLCESYRDANREIVLPAILLHDIGWSTVPEDKQLQSFGPHMIYPELRRQHETEGAQIAAQKLRKLGYDDDLIAKISHIIDGHDTLDQSLSLEDSLVKDADKLWRYTPFGLETVGDWFNYTPDAQMALLKRWIGTRFYTDAGRDMARGLYASLEIETIHLFMSELDR